MPAKSTKADAGRLGGSHSSDSKINASRLNGRKGGRPAKYLTDAERKAAAVARQMAYLARKRKG